MRVYAFALVTTSTAILTHNTSPSGTRIPTKTQVDPSTIARSPDGSHDDVPAKQLLRAGEITAGEERIPQSIEMIPQSIEMIPQSVSRSIHEQIMRAINTLLDAFHERNKLLQGLSNSEQVSRKASDRVALEYQLAKMQVEPSKLLEILKAEGKKAKDGRSDLMKAAQVPSNELSNELMEQGVLHPEDVIKKVITATKVNSLKPKFGLFVRNPVGPDLEYLTAYLRKSNPADDTPLDLLGLLSQYFDGVADLATFLANANLDKKNKTIVMAIQGALFKQWIDDKVSIGDAIKLLRIPSKEDVIEGASGALTTHSHKEAFVANKNLDTLNGYIDVYINEYPSSLPTVVQVLSELLGNCQASMLITKGSTRDRSTMAVLWSKMYDHWEKEGLTPDELAADFNEENRIRPSLYTDHWRVFEEYKARAAKKKEQTLAQVSRH